VKADRCIWKPCSKSSIWERTKKHLSLLETFYKLFYWIEKESTNNNYNGLLGGSDRRSVKADRLICKPLFQIVNLRERKQNIILCWKDFTNNIYWIKKESINNNYNGLQGIGPSVDRLICKPLFQIVNLRERKQNIILCWKDFTNNIYRVKKRINRQ
jgi:hypothetical protein